MKNHNLSLFIIFHKWSIYIYVFFSFEKGHTFVILLVEVSSRLCLHFWWKLSRMEAKKHTDMEKNKQHNCLYISSLLKSCQPGRKRDKSRENWMDINCSHLLTHFQSICEIQINFLEAMLLKLCCLSPHRSPLTWPSHVTLWTASGRL